MSPQRAQMIEAMILAGLAEGTQEAYVRAVRQLAAYYRRSPDRRLRSRGTRGGGRHRETRGLPGFRPRPATGTLEKHRYTQTYLSYCNRRGTRLDSRYVSSCHRAA
jgi:hypothetical protein